MRHYGAWIERLATLGPREPRRRAVVLGLLGMDVDRHSHGLLRVEAEPRGQCVPRQSLGTRFARPGRGFARDLATRLTIYSCVPAPLNWIKRRAACRMPTAEMENRQCV